MISAIELENFKGIGDRVRLELAPLTLVFGPNNAGKSTLLHALVYLHEVLERGEVDVDHTTLAGRSLDLGGFERIVHRHHGYTTLAIRVELDIPSTLNVLARQLVGFPWPDLDDALERVWVEVRVGRDAGHGWSREPTVSAVSVGTSASSSPLVRIHMSPTEEQAKVAASRRLVELDLAHPLLVTADAADLDQIKASAPFVEGDKVTVYWDDPHRSPTALPPLNEAIDVHPYIVLPGVDPADRSPHEAVADLVNLLAIGALRHTRDALRTLLYVGPLRAVPPRGFHHLRRTGHHWSDGLAAWDALYWDEELMRDANDWLDRLGTGVALAAESYESDDIEVATRSDTSLKYVRRLFVVSGRLPAHKLPCEVGAGLCQLIPVVAAALYSRTQLALIEQPELHVHPALQVALGDLLIAQCESRQLIIETHSEHLVLRILRRIRETHSNEPLDGAPRFEADKLSVLYVEPSETGTTVKRLGVDATGEFTEHWPTGFFEERARELF